MTTAGMRLCEVVLKRSIVVSHFNLCLTLPETGAIGVQLGVKASYAHAILTKPGITAFSGIQREGLLSSG